MSIKSVPLIKQSPPRLAHHDYTVGWICALPQEQAAATVMLDELHENLANPIGDHNTYTLGSIGSHNVVSWWVSAAALLPKFDWVTLSWAPPSGQWPGLVQWDFGKTESEGFKRIGALNNPPAPLLTALSNLEARHQVEGSRIRHHLDVVESKGKKLALRFTRRDHLHDPLDASILTFLGFLLGRWAYTPPRANGQGAKIESLEEPKVHYGLIASGNQVIKDARYRDSLNTSLGGEILCIEMEAAGVANNFPCLAIHGICDYADEGKNKDWQEYAAGVAAAFTKELLVVQPIELNRERSVKDVLDQGSISTLFKGFRHV
ncbi:hypothetical protein ASPCAL02750 [Aspergillus calidoustus]|uniref:Nucleoside phosphorylase domain-containing protein n=1 Tax=Aspergillus calidoustus TaxID=454130 RepID=A0A0U5GPN9_ASPCI|nr:hypothetical protein ASPCAL02750 [Aspergillus calidoustus]